MKVSMEENDIQLITSGTNIDIVREILSRFLKSNENVFSFPSLSTNNNRVLLWTALFEYLKNASFTPVHSLCLAAIRILSRDKVELENLLCENWIIILMERAGIYQLVNYEDESMTPTEFPDQEIMVEALKCLCNLAFNSEVAQALCAHTSIAHGLIARVRIYRDIPFKEDIMHFDMKLLFILTALRQDIRNKVRDELHGMDYLTSSIKELLIETSPSQAIDASASYCLVEGGPHCFLTDIQQTIICEVLKTQFNLILRPGSDEGDDSDDTTYLKLMPVLSSLLAAKATNEDKLMELRSNIANLLTAIPNNYYSVLTPKLNPGENPPYVYDGLNMNAVHALLELLQYRLTKTTKTTTQYENLSPILTVLNKASRGCRAHRKYLRGVVLPPLRDVSTPPEKGNTIRNQLCRLLTTPDLSVRSLVAEFLFILCKEKVGRLVKYTGFGNAAGHLAQKGLLGGRSGDRMEYSSSSDDSDTEEYREAQPHFDPVVGCTRPPRVNPFEGMSEEQKEHEAMKLVNLFDKMLSEGVVKPARVGPDGRPQPVHHVLQLREEAPNRTQSS